jgi:hypothetical protein
MSGRRSRAALNWKAGSATGARQTSSCLQSACIGVLFILLPRVPVEFAGIDDASSGISEARQGLTVVEGCDRVAERVPRVYSATPPSDIQHPRVHCSTGSAQRLSSKPRRLDRSRRRCRSFSTRFLRYGVSGPIPIRNCWISLIVKGRSALMSCVEFAEDWISIIFYLFQNTERAFT